MRRNKILIRFFLITFFFSTLLQNCNLKNENEINMDSIVIPDSLYSFFPPENSTNLNLKLLETNAENHKSKGKAHTFLGIYFTKIYICENATQFDLLVYKYQQEAIDSLKPTDNNYFIVKYESDMLKMYEYKTLKEKYIESINKYILPSFHDDIRYFFGVNYNLTTTCGLPDDYEILIMKSGREYVLPDNNTWKFDWELLPLELKHGYTSGISYRSYKDPIIFWCIAW